MAGRRIRRGPHWYQRDVPLTVLVWMSLGAGRFSDILPNVPAEIHNISLEEHANFGSATYTANSELT